VTRRGRADDYRIAIPSYRRADRLATTLALVDRSRVTVFVDDADDTLPAYRALGVDVAVLSTRGIGPARHAMARHFPPGTPVVGLEDDVTGVVTARGKDLVPITDLDGWLRNAFTTTAAHDLWVWGVNPVPNAFYMKAGLTVGLRYAIGTLHGFFSRPDHPVHAPARVPVKEDYELSLRAWWYDGGIVRFSDVAVRADHYRAPGGCVDTRTVWDSETAAATLIADWPGLVRRNTTRASGHAEIILAARRRHLGHPSTATPPVSDPLKGSPVIHS